MRASGISRLRMMGSVGIAGVILLVLMVLLGESLAPSLGDGLVAQVMASAETVRGRFEADGEADGADDTA